MSDYWVIRMAVWPFSGISQGGGAGGDQKLAGPKDREFQVKAEDLKAALAKADLIVEGIKSSGYVWEVKLKSIEGKQWR